MSHGKVVDFHQNAVANHLRAIHPIKTAEHVAAAIGYPVETVRPWLRGAARPNGAAMLALVGVYGLELLAAALPSAPEWVNRALIAERRRAAMDEIRRLRERLEAFGNDEGTAPALLGRAVGGGLRDGLDTIAGARADDAGG